MQRKSSEVTKKDLLLLLAIIFFLILILKLGDRLVYGWGYPPIKQLLIDATPFPSGWIADEIDTDFPPSAPWTTGRDEIEYARRQIYSNPILGYGGSATIILQRFRNPSAASKYFQREVSLEFRDTDWNTPWIVPENLKFESVTADRYQYACSQEGEPSLAKPRCVYVAQYDVYVIELYIGIYDAKAISYEDLIPIFEAIDQKMSKLRW